MQINLLSSLYVPKNINKNMIYSAYTQNSIKKSSSDVMR